MLTVKEKLQRGENGRFGLKIILKIAEEKKIQIRARRPQITNVLCLKSCISFVF